MEREGGIKGAHFVLRKIRGPDYPKMHNCVLEAHICRTRLFHFQVHAEEAF